MKVVVVGTALINGRSGPVWTALHALIGALAKTDTLIHTGGGTGLGADPTLGSGIDYLKRRAKGIARDRFPKLEAQVPEIGRYPLAEALHQNAMQLLAHHQPNTVVYIGEGLDLETREVMELWERVYKDQGKIELVDVDTFVANRSRRDVAAQP